MKLKMLSAPLLVIVSLVWASFQNDALEKTLRLDDHVAMCHLTTQKFAQLADDEDFIDIHPDPLSYDNFQGSGEMTTYPIAGGEAANAYLVRSVTQSSDYLFVIHEWYGLNAYVKSESEKFAKQFEDMNVIALDLYDGKVAQTSEKAREYMQSVQTDRALDIINGAKSFAGKEANIYTIGWCFGGGWSLQAAIEIGDQAAGAVMFYGMPEEDLARLKTLQCDVLGIFALQDRWINPEVAEANMSKTNQDLTLKSYDADHGFANPSNPKYDAEATADAYQNMFDFIAARR